jgi:polygalacturonase
MRVQRRIVWLMATVVFGIGAVARGAEPLEVKVAPPVIPDKTFRLADFGAVGDGKTLNTDAFKKAIAAVEKAGGGRLIVDQGVYRTLPFELCSSLDLHLETGAVIMGPASFADYGIPEPETLKSQSEVNAKVRAPAPFITGHNLHDLALTGDGVIDGNGAIWWAWSERAARNKGGNRLIYPRPHLVVINGCERMHVEGVTFRNSPKFHLIPNHVTDLLIERAKFEAPEMAPNTDAIDPSLCTRMIIRDCDINVGDDDVAIKSGGHQLLVEDCRIKHGHGVSIGSGTAAGISQFVVRRCTFEGTDNGIRIKSMRGAGGPVEDVQYTDIKMAKVANAIVLDLNYVDNNRPNFRGDPSKIPSIRNVLIENVTVDGARNAGRIVGLPDSKITDITLKNVHITAEKDLVIENVGTIHRDDVTVDIKPNVGPPPRKELE